MFLKSQKHINIDQNIQKNSKNSKPCLKDSPNNHLEVHFFKMLRIKHLKLAKEIIIQKPKQFANKSSGAKEHYKQIKHVGVDCHSHRDQEVCSYAFTNFNSVNYNRILEPSMKQSVVKELEQDKPILLNQIRNEF